MRREDLRRALVRNGGAVAEPGRGAFDETSPALLASWHNCALLAELRLRTLRASIAVRDGADSPLTLAAQAALAHTQALLRALEPKIPALTPEQHNAFPKGRWAVANGGGAK